MKPLPADRAREIVQRFLLAPGQEVTQTRQVGDAFIVQSEDWWQVERIDRWLNFEKSDLYELYEARLYVSADPPPSPHGFAIPPDGEVFHLNDADQFRAFFAALPDRPAAVELAGLLTRYAPAEHGGTQALILSPDDLRNLLYPEHLETLADVIRLTTKPLPDEGLALDFCSYYIMTGGETQADRLALNRWHVEVKSPGSLDWRVESLAVGLPSPLYT